MHIIKKNSVYILSSVKDDILSRLKASNDWADKGGTQLTLFSKLDNNLILLYTNI